MPHSGVKKTKKERMKGGEREIGERQMVRGIRKEKGRMRNGRIMRGKHAGIKERGKKVQPWGGGKRE